MDRNRLNIFAAAALISMVALDSFLISSPALGAFSLLAGLLLMVLTVATVRRPRVLLLGMICGLLAVTPAIAQAVVAPVTGDAANGSTLFHIPPAIWTEVNELLVGLFLALGAMAWKWIDAHSPLKQTQAEDIARNAFQTLLLTGAKYGVSQLNGAETKVGDIDVGNAAVAAGANFVIEHGPDLAAQVGFDITTPAGQAAIIRSVTARVSQLLPSNVTGSIGDPVGPTTIPLPAVVQPVAPAAGVPVPGAAA